MPGLKLKSLTNALLKYGADLRDDQYIAYENILQGKCIGCLQGFAGTGKSHLLVALKGAYEDAGYTVRALGPDTTTVKVLAEKGFKAQTVHRFTYRSHFGHEKIAKSKELWIIDEAGKLANDPLLELLKYAQKNKIQVLLTGDPAQLPPVGRGGIFKHFSQRYSSQLLTEVKRQKNEQYRQITTDLARGKMGHAIDQLTSLGAIKWCQDKRSSMTHLINQWAQDRLESPHQSSIILGYTNREIQTLNELARLVRLYRKEISHREFECKILMGVDLVKCYFSSGDLIEFKRNDKELKVSQGDRGLLIATEENKFTVAICEKNKYTRCVEFNPHEYFAYQLGYATTFNRGQGRDADKVYVLHSAHISRQMLYVGLTRHLIDVKWYVSKDETKSLANLKIMAAIDKSKLTSPEFSNPIELEEAQQRQAIHKLKQSDDISTKLQGYTLELWTAIKATLDQSKDLIANEKFFNQQLQTANASAYAKELENSGDFFNPWSTFDQDDLTKEVLEKDHHLIPSSYIDPVVAVEQELDSQDLSDVDETLKNLTLQELFVAKEKIKGAHYSSEENLTWEEKKTLSNQLVRRDANILYKGLPPPAPSKKSETPKDQTKPTPNLQTEKIKAQTPPDIAQHSQDTQKKSLWAGLSQEEQKAFKQYRAQVQHIAGLKESLRIESELRNIELKQCLNYKEFLQACGGRNQTAHALMKLTKSENIEQLQGTKSLQVIRNQAAKHQEFEDRKTKENPQDLERQIYPHIESLVSQLFYDRPIRKERNSYRIGSKGALCIQLAGKKPGTFYDHENKAGGGMVQLISKELNLNYKEAIKWTKNFLGDVPDVKISAAYQRPKPTQNKNWVSLKPDPKYQAPKLSDMGNYFSENFKEVARYPFHDAKGNLIYYTLRAEDQQGRKQVLPLSYGYDPRYNKPQWKIIGYSCNIRPLYNLPSVTKNPNATILIVEGEKTANAAPARFPDKDIIAVTWSGGAQAALKSDWMALTGRKVIIWPDNDKPGFEAAQTISKELRKYGVKSLEIVDPKVLSQTFPSKWDLADPMPEGASEPLLSKLLTTKTLDMTLNLESVLARAESRGLKIDNDIYSKTSLNRILMKVDDRLRDSLQIQNTPSQVNEVIKTETINLLIEEQKSKPHLRSNHGADGQLLDLLARQVILYKARFGKEPSDHHIDTMKDVIRAFGKGLDYSDPSKAAGLAAERILEKLCGTAIIRGLVEMPDMMQEKLPLLTKSIEKQLNHQQVIERGIQQDLSHQQELGM